MFRLFWGRSGLLGVVALAAVLALLPASAQAGQPDLQRARQATAAYHDQGKALADGYQAFLGCFESSDGGMGQHYVNFDLMNGTLDPAHPEALVYEVTPTGERLVALEYLVPYTAAPSNGPPPVLFDAQFSRHDDLEVWALHAWVWRPNPAGMHEDFNTNAAMCP